MNIADFIRSVNVFDLLVVLILFAFFILGFIQGTIRRLLGLLAILFSFLVAANLREPFGNFLSREWTHLPESYAVMLGFGTVFVAASVAFTVVIQTFYKKVPLFEKYAVADEVLGGILGVLQGFMILAAMIVILDSAFEIPGVGRAPNELPFLREIHAAYDPSVSASFMRNQFIPFLFTIFGIFIPNELRAFFPGSGLPPPSA